MIRPYGDVLIPDGDDAREWAEKELSDPRYADAKPTWFDELAKQIGRFLQDLFTSDGGASAGPAALIIVCVIVFAALVIALIIWGRPRRSRSIRRPGSSLLGSDDDRSAAELRAEATRAAKSGDWDTATILRFRALARHLLERDLIDPSPGATAQAIAREVSLVFVAEEGAVRTAATSFDDVRYLRRPATEESYAALVAVDERLAALRPEPVPA